MLCGFLKSSEYHSEHKFCKEKFNWKYNSNNRDTLPEQSYKLK